ncbi:MAG: hypothetical protein E7466_05485 [Ruminococcaceae bacterium]|nr:hypothetical protein [Oscillospiraceae bacterium]
MKKLIALALVFVLALAVFAGCGKEADEGDTTTKATVKGEPMTDDSDKTPDTPAPEATADVVYDDNGITITVLGLEESFWGSEVKVKVANETDKNVCLSTDDCIVNGITVGGMGLVEVPAGETVTDGVCAFAVDLESAGIETVGTISFPNATIMDSDTFETLYATPFAITADESYQQSIDDSGKVLFSDKGITVQSRILKDDPNDEVVYLLIKNKTGKEINVEGVDILVNGKEVESWLYDVVYADTVRYSDFTLSLADLGDAVETVEFSLIFIDDDYNTLAETEKLTITVE